MARFVLFPMAAVALLVLMLVVGALLWALIGSRRSGAAFAAFVVLALLVGLPLLLVGVYFETARPIEGVRLTAVRDVDADAPRPPESTDAEPQAPGWLDQEAQQRRDGAVLRTVTGRRFATQQASRDDALRAAAEQARDYLQQAAPRPVRWEVPVSFVQDELVRDEYVAQVNWEAEGVYSPPFAEPMYQAHLLVEFTPQKRDALLQMWQKDVLGQRIRWLAAGSAFLLVLLATSAGYLRLDEATRGYYSGRLKLAAVAVVGVTGAALLSVLA